MVLQDRITQFKCRAFAFSQFALKYGLIKSSLSNVFAKITGMILSILTVKYGLESIGQEQFGIWMSVLSIMGFISFADIGLGNQIVNSIAATNTESNLLVVKKLISNAFICLLAISLTLCLVGLLIIPFLDWCSILNIQDAALNKIVILMVLIYTLSFAINLPISIVSKIQHGQHKLWIPNIYLCVGNVLSCCFLLFAYMTNQNIYVIILSTISGPLIASAFNFFLYFNTTGNEIKPSLSCFHCNEIKPLFKFGSHFFILQIFSVLGNASDNIIIAQAMGIEFVAEYSVVQKLSLMLAFSQFYITPLWPIFSEALDKGDLFWAKRLFVKSFVISGIIGILSGSIILFFGKNIIEAWTSNTIFVSYSLLLGFALQSIVMGLGGIVSVYVNNMRYLSLQTFWFISASIISILLKIMLIRTYHSTSAVIFSTFISYLIFFIIPLCIIIMKEREKKSS
jgi:O-antigen/teichoic acid export membrane protein